MAPPLKRDPRFRQGVYKPTNPKKFMGTTAIYRSGLECKFFRFCDLNENVIRWGSENIVIPYKSKIDNQFHRYYVDNYVEIKEGEVIVKYLVEIKPYSQTQPPKPSNKKKKSTMIYEQTQWIINSEGKWKAADDYCKKRGWKFLILTEKELK
jgi:hypothetical protein